MFLTRFEPVEAAQQPHGLAVVVSIRVGDELLLQRPHPLLRPRERPQVVVERRLRLRLVEGERAQPRTMLPAPVPHVVAEAAAQQQFREPVLRPRAVGHRVVARPGEVAHRLLVRRGRMDLGEQTRPQQFCQISCGRGGRSLPCRRACAGSAPGR